MEESKKERANKDGKEKERKQTFDVDEPAGNTAEAEAFECIWQKSVDAGVGAMGRLGYSGRAIKQTLRKGIKV